MTDSKPPEEPTPEQAESTEPEVFAGGHVPEPTDILSTALSDITDDIGPHLMAGIGQMLVVLPVVLVMIFVIYFGIFFVTFAGILATTLVSSVATEVGGDAFGGLAGLVTSLLSVVFSLGMFALVMLAVVAITAPINASLYRRVAKHQKGEKTLDLSACFSDATENIVSVIMVGFLQTTAILIGILFCYLPGLIAAAAFSHASHLVIFHRLRPVAAMKRSVVEVKAHLNFHIVYGIMMLVVGMIAAYIPFLGALFISSAHVRTYRNLFGDGPDPVFPSEVAPQV